MFIPRTLQRTLHRLIRSYPVLAITGPRQSGKTTLLRKQFPEYRYVSLEKAGRLYIAEIKATRTPTARHFKPLEKFRKTAPLPIAKASLIYGGEEAFEHKGIHVLPWKSCKLL